MSYCKRCRAWSYIDYHMCAPAWEWGHDADCEDGTAYGADIEEAAEWVAEHGIEWENEDSNEIWIRDREGKARKMLIERDWEPSYSVTEAEACRICGEPESDGLSGCCSMKCHRAYWDEHYAKAKSNEAEA